MSILVFLAPHITFEDFTPHLEDQMPVEQGLVPMVAQDGVLFYFSFGVNSESL